MKRYFVHTMGCQMNRADSDSMGKLLHGCGMTETHTREDAHIIIVNTCTVRKNVELKAFAYIGRLQQLKERKPDLKIIVAGCMAQRLGKQLQKKFPFVDIVVGARDIDLFPSLLRSICPSVPEGRWESRDPQATGSPVSAFVTIMRGCDNLCSYCIVPLVRGREISRPADDILAEVKLLAGSGIKEVTLVGQNVNSYAGRRGDDRVDFPGLLQAVSAIDGIERFRFTTSHPKNVSEALIRVMAANDKVCKHIHLPLQSGSDRVLKAMNRNYTAADYARRAARMREAMPAVSLTTDILVGFPGEKDEDFRATMRMVEEIRFNSLFAYQYSPREGTAAFSLVDDVPLELKQARYAEILALADKIAEEKNALMLNTVQKVLVENEKDLFHTGRTIDNTKVYFFTNDPGITVGSSVDIRITECRIRTLIGAVYYGARHTNSDVPGYPAL